MLRKTLVAAAVFAATSGLAFANGGSFTPAAPAAPAQANSFYVGVDISRDLGRYESDNDIIATALGFDTGSTDYSGEGIGGTLFVGYGMTFMDRYYLALEGFGDITSNSSQIGAGLKFDQEWSAGVRLTPGIKLTDSTTLYAIAGWINSEFKFKDNTGTITDTEKHLNGLQTGLGIETMVTQNIGLRGEWDWNYFGAYKVGGVKVFNHPTVDQFKFGIDYHFNAA